MSSITPKLREFLKEKPILKTGYVLIAILALTGLISAPLSLGLGLAFSLIFGNPLKKYSDRASKQLLKLSVIGLGFGMNIYSVMEAGKSGILFTIATILGTLILGYLIGRILRIERKTSILISSGTAICGGSAIAAVGPAINADSKSMSVSLVTIFILNAVALFIFPVIGNWLQLSQQQFGLWSAIAIHDTSSVVGAASKFGEEALEIATTVKLTRALWIIPITLFFALISREKGHKKIQIPWFIFLFIGATLITTYLPQGELVYKWIKTASKHGLILTLYFIGSSLSLDDIKSIGYKPIIQGVLLWIIISIVSVIVILKAI